MVKISLYEQVTEITKEYLGPASDRFISRLISAHLGKEPYALKPKDIPKLSEWIKVSLGLLTEDRKLVDECEKQILKLAKE